MTNEELDKARADEAWRKCDALGFGKDYESPTIIAARLAREGWTPPEPVDPDVLAYREWEVSQLTDHFDREKVLAGKWDRGVTATAYLAGARMAREQEQERAKVLVEPAEAIVNRAVRGTGSNDLRWPHILKAARRLEKGLNAYKAGKEAGK
jgi:hypothetical protein